MFVLTSDITIGEYRFSGVHEVIIKRSIHSMVETAVIKLPSIATVIKNGKVIKGRVVTIDEFGEGERVEIKLGYNGAKTTEFVGFVKRRKASLPAEIECEGYSALLRKNATQSGIHTGSVKDLIRKALGNTENYIKLICDIEFDLKNVNTANLSGFDAINTLAKSLDDNLTCFFLYPDTLWCGFLYTDQSKGHNLPGLPAIKYRVGYNTLRKNTLMPHVVDGKYASVKYSYRKGDGSIEESVSNKITESGEQRTKSLNQVASSDGLKALAGEWAYKSSYKGYEGSITCFLEPYAAPGYRAVLEDSWLPERSGTYLIESTEVVFGMGGARRKVELGPKVGFDK